MDAALTPFALAGPATPRPASQASEWWMGIYLGAAKVGYLHQQTTPEGSGKQRRYRQRTVTSIRGALLGTPMQLRVEDDQLLNADLRPIRIDARIDSGGRRSEVQAQFHEDRVEVCRRSGDASERKTLPIPAGVALTGDAEIPLLHRNAKVGHTWRCAFLNLVTLALEEATVRVIRQEPITVGKETLNALVIQTQAASFDSTSWLQADGRPIKIVMTPGLTMVGETRQEALSGLEDSPGDPRYDLAVQTAVRLRGSIQNPGRVRFLRLRIGGIPEKRFVLSDTRQRAWVVDAGEALTVEYTVDAEAFVAAPRLSSADRAALLHADMYLEADHPEVVARAREVTAGAHDDRARMEALWQWVYANVVWRADIGTPRSALDVLRDPAGVCRDRATLYAALARAAGIPTRLCAGIVHSRDGFYYHAWAESLVDGQWVPADPTVPPPFVDATRIKFAEGDASAMYGASRIVGRLEAEILEQR